MVPLFMSDIWVGVVNCKSTRVKISEELIPHGILKHDWNFRMSEDETILKKFLVHDISIQHERV